MKGFWYCFFGLAAATLTGQSLPALLQDSTFKKLVRYNRVRAVTELYENKQMKYVSYHYKFDKNGYVSEQVQSSGKSLKRIKFENDSNGRILNLWRFADGDSSKVETAESFIYDVKGSKLSEKITWGIGPEVHIRTVSFNTLAAEPGLSRIQTETAEDSTLQYTVIETDSLSGEIRYDIRLQRFHKDHRDEEGALHYTKKLSTHRRKGNLVFNENFDIELYGDEEIINTHHGYYSLYDVNNRIIENGVCNYRLAMDGYFRQYPQQMLHKMVHPEVMRLLISGKFNPERRALSSYTYDTSGRKKTFKDYSGLKTYMYDKDGRLSETLVTVPDSPSVLRHTYNEKGLLISTVSIDKYNQQEWKQDFVYSYHD